MFSAFKFGEFASKALFKKIKSIIHLDTSWESKRTNRLTLEPGEILAVHPVVDFVLQPLHLIFLSRPPL